MAGFRYASHRALSRARHWVLWPLLALALLVPALVAPAPASAFTKAIWGPPSVNGVDQFPLYHRLHVGILEMGLTWDQVAPVRPAHPTNPNDPAYHWPAEVAQAIAEARTYHMRILLQVSFAPAWADGGHSAPGWAPKNPTDYATFLATAARRYPSVHLWMIWGEPDKRGSFQPNVSQAVAGHPLTRAQKRAPHLYARVLDASYAALKRVSRANKVIGGCTYTSGLADPAQWIENLRLPNGRAPRMDMYGHNPFGYLPPVFTRTPSPFGEIQFSDLKRLGKLVDRYLHPGLPLFLSEFTIPTRSDLEFNYWVEPRTAAQWVTEALRNSRRWHRIYALGWIHVYDEPPESYGGLLTAAGKPKPDYFAFARG
ncbi:MAG TPA: hypothetical protein VFP55_04040 [Solirubrobacteraceae bacterium]|nr:hypothetical protein [Solirubrobacteraceae bacterium]